MESKQMSKKSNKHEAIRVAMKGGSTINFNSIAGDSDWAIRSIKAHSDAIWNLPTDPTLNDTPQGLRTTPMESKMKGFKTVTHDGQVYQIGKAYLFLSTNGRLEFGCLTKVNSASQFPFINHLTEDFSSIECVPEFRGGFGTITPAPRELDNGAAYMFDCDTDVSVMGIFCKRGGLFLVNDGACFNACFCTNIRLMTVVENGKSHE